MVEKQSDDLENRSTVYSRIRTLDKWIEENSVMHPDFMKNYKERDELKIKLQAINDRLSSKGAGVYLPDIQAPSGFNH